MYLIIISQILNMWHCTIIPSIFRVDSKPRYSGNGAENTWTSTMAMESGINNPNLVSQRKLKLPSVKSNWLQYVVYNTIKMHDVFFFCYSHLKARKWVDNVFVLSLIIINKKYKKFTEITTKRTCITHVISVIRDTYKMKMAVPKTKRLWKSQTMCFDCYN